jgi:hypothetical protein
VLIVFLLEPEVHPQIHGAPRAIHLRHLRISGSTTLLLPTAAFDHSRYSRR